MLQFCQERNIAINEEGKYEVPIMEVVQLAAEDIIVTSITCEGIDTPIDCFFDF